MVRLLAVRYKLEIENGHAQNPKMKLIKILFLIIIFYQVRIITIFILSLNFITITVV